MVRSLSFGYCFRD